MKEVRYSTQAKKDLKQYRNDRIKMQNLYVVLSILASGNDLPQHYHPHGLSGDYEGCMECHIENDYLLIWIDSDAIYIQRIGTHAELFGKGRKR